MLPTLQIRLFGDFQLLYQGELVTTLHQARLQSLLAYLVLHRRAPQSRRHLAYRLWPDSTEAQARTNLRRELHHLRNTLPEAEQFLAIGAQTVQWRVDAPYTLDIADFERALAQADEAERTGQQTTLGAALAQAVELYTGDLLPSCYDEWIISDRERLRQHYIGVMERLAEHHEEQAHYRAAIQVAERLLRHDPIHEATYQRLMRLHMLNGDRAHALRVYHLCVAALQRELAVEPSEETRMLYERLLEVEAAPLAAAQPTLINVAENSSLVARGGEWRTLQRAWQMARRDRIHFALIAGEAGIGKTRLAEELLIWAGQHGIATARTRSYAAEGRLAYAPVVEWLRSDPVQAARRQLGDVWLSEAARLLPEVVEERPHLPPPAPLTESWQRVRFFEGLARALLLGSAPLMLLIDDLQWCDQETLEWLRFLLRFAQTQRQGREQVLIVGTVRPEEVGTEHPLMALLLEMRSTGQFTEIELGPLNEAETSELAHAFAGNALDPEQAAHLYRVTQGNPLFVIETLRSGGHDAATSAPRDQPRHGEVGVSALARGEDHPMLAPKIYAIIRARLAQLSPSARELAGLAAAIGRAFTFELLAHASEAGEDTLVHGLDELWQRRILREQSVSGYDFSHDRIRDVAYAEIGPAQRRLLHRRIAQALEQLHAANLDTVCSQIASHYTQAGLPQPAIVYYEQAAAAALQVYAHADVVAYLTRALELLSHLPVTTERPAQELKLQLDLGLSLGTLKGFSAAAVREVYTRAQELAVQVGDDEQHLKALGGLFSYHIWRGQVRTAQALAEQGIPLAERISDPSWLAAALGRLGVILFYQGQWQASRSNLEHALAKAVYERRSRMRLEAAGQDSMVLHRRHLAIALWHLGYPDQALAHTLAAQAQAQELGHLYTLVSSLAGSAWLHYLRREVQETRTQAEAGIALEQQKGLSNPLDRLHLFLGWALIQQGQIEAGMAQMRESLAHRNASDYRNNQSMFLAMLAEAYGSTKQPEQGLRLLDQAWAHVEASGERVFEPELHRFQGELLYMQGTDPQAVESHFLRALAVARQQEAKSLELRAAVSLGRLWQQQGRSPEAHKLLSEIYGWFTEGFDTPDLQNARSLLAELSS
jgi:DNA-binding SARP family transcriptional activator/predicted ATPase